MDKNNLTKELERILTIDGIGRPKKASLLLALIHNDNDINKELIDALTEISQRKFF
jgi:hypothetical protein